MIVISYGMAKSGSTLAFKMARAVLELNGHEQIQIVSNTSSEKPKKNRVGEWTDESLRSAIDASRGTCVVLKTHRKPDLLSTGVVFDALDRGELKIHVVYRDPRDIVLSMLDHGARSRAKQQGPLRRVVDVDSAMTVIRGALRNLRRWGTYPSLKLCYDRFAFDRPLGPTLIADDLHMEVDAEEVWERVDRSGTKKNRAVPHRWRTEMSTEDSALVESTVPNFVRLVEHDDLSWFQRVG